MPDADAIRNLRWLSRKLGDGLLDAVVVTTGPRAYRRPDGIAVLLAALLGPRAVPGLAAQARNPWAGSPKRR